MAEAAAVPPNTPAPGLWGRFKDRVFRWPPRFPKIRIPLFNLLAWLGIAIFFALAPQWIRILQGVVEGCIPGTDQLLGRGEVLMLSVALFADAMAKLIMRSKTGFSTALLGSFVGCLILVTVASFEFAFVQERVESNAIYQKSLIATHSMVTLALSVLIGAILVEER